MKSRPILFSTEMVQAILDGLKTMTRRIVQTEKFGWNCHEMKFERICTYDNPKPNLQAFFTDNSEFPLLGVKCPYGEPGDQLWVRETFTTDLFSRTVYRATDGEVDGVGRKFTWTSSRFMPRAASRITLKITNIKVERLQDITEDDAEKEGSNLDLATGTFRYGFASLWESINGKKSWDKNPWVWVIEFEPIK